MLRHDGNCVYRSPEGGSELAFDLRSQSNTLFTIGMESRPHNKHRSYRQRLGQQDHPRYALRPPESHSLRLPHLHPSRRKCRISTPSRITFPPRHCHARRWRLFHLRQRLRRSQARAYGILPYNGVGRSETGGPTGMSEEVCDKRIGCKFQERVLLMPSGSAIIKKQDIGGNISDGSSFVGLSHVGKP